MVDAEHGDAVERQPLDEVPIRRLHRLEVAPEVHVLRVHVGDDADGRRQPEEAAVALVGLDHHPVALAKPGIGAVGVDDAAVDHGGLEPRRIEQAGDDGGRRRLAVRAGDRDRRVQPHDLAQHVGAADDGQPAAARLLQLGIVGLDRGRDHQHLRLAQILGLVADADRHAHAAQALHVGVLGNVRALHAVAHAVQDLGDAAHADAADADEMDGAGIQGLDPQAAAAGLHRWGHSTVSVVAAGLLGLAIGALPISASTASASTAAASLR